MIMNIGRWRTIMLTEAMIEVEWRVKSKARALGRSDDVNLLIG
jgi:hypothetical protein